MSAGSPANILHADGSWHADTWRLVRDDDADTPAAGDLLPLARFLALPPEARGGLGVWLRPADDPLALAGHVAATRLIAVDFPTFRDGRGYSTATLLRTRVKFGGDLRATGDVLVDQLAYLRRVGFSQFALRADQSPQRAAAALAGFSDAYQASVSHPQPLFRRRALAAART
jgi:uncharacterized protein (DUF934 family)